jgi:hypothetical protein
MLPHFQEDQTDFQVFESAYRCPCPLLSVADSSAATRASMSSISMAFAV